MGTDLPDWIRARSSPDSFAGATGRRGQIAPTEMGLTETGVDQASLRLGVLRVEVKMQRRLGLLLGRRRGPDPVEDGLRRARVAALDRVEQGPHQAAPATDPPLVAEARVALDEALELLLQGPVEGGAVGFRDSLRVNLGDDRRHTEIYLHTGMDRKRAAVKSL